MLNTTKADVTFLHLHEVLLPKKTVHFTVIENTELLNFADKFFHLRNVER